MSKNVLSFGSTVNDLMMLMVMVMVIKDVKNWCCDQFRFLWNTGNERSYTLYCVYFNILLPYFNLCNLFYLVKKRHKKKHYLFSLSAHYPSCHSSSDSSKTHSRGCGGHSVLQVKAVLQRYTGQIYLHR